MLPVTVTIVASNLPVTAELVIQLECEGWLELDHGVLISRGAKSESFNP